MPVCARRPVVPMWVGTARAPARRFAGKRRRGQRGAAVGPRPGTVRPCAGHQQRKTQPQHHAVHESLHHAEPWQAATPASPARGWGPRALRWCACACLYATLEDDLHNSLRSVIARSRAVHCVAFVANSRATGLQKTPCGPSRSALPPTRWGCAGHP